MCGIYSRKGMIKICHTFILSFLLLACNNVNESINTDIPSCLQNILDDPELHDEVNSIRVQEKSNELHYWINTDARFLDGLEWIVNAQCDSICSLGGFMTQECARKYNTNWVIIWER